MTAKVKGDRVVIGSRVGTVNFIDRDGGWVLFDLEPGASEQDVLILTMEELNEAPYEPLPLVVLFAAAERGNAAAHRSRMGACQ